MLLKRSVPWSEIAPPSKPSPNGFKPDIVRDAKRDLLQVQKTQVGEWTIGNVAVGGRDDEGAKRKRNEPIDGRSQKPHHLHHNPLGHPWEPHG